MQQAKIEVQHESDRRQAGENVVAQETRERIIHEALRLFSGARGFLPHTDRRQLLMPLILVRGPSSIISRAKSIFWGIFASYKWAESENLYVQAIQSREPMDRVMHRAVHYNYTGIRAFSRIDSERASPDIFQRVHASRHGGWISRGPFDTGRVNGGQTKTG